MAYNNGDDEKGMSARQKFKLEKLKLMEPSAKPEGGKPTSSAKAKAAVMAAMSKKKKGMS